MKLLRENRGALTRIADKLGISRSAVSQWEKVPAERIPEIELISGIPRAKLRPDLWTAAEQNEDAA